MKTPFFSVTDVDTPSKVFHRISPRKFKASICPSHKRGGFRMCDPSRFLFGPQEPYRFDPSGTKYIALNYNRNQFYYSSDISQDLIGHLNSNGVSFATLASDGNYFIKHKNGWNARLPPKHSENLGELKRHVANFDGMIRGLLFGHGQTHIFFAGGFTSELNEETENNAEHPLTKMRWFLPEAMSQKLAELQQLTESPEDQMCADGFRRLRVSVRINVLSPVLNELRMADRQRRQADNDARKLQDLVLQQMRHMAQMSARTSHILVESAHAIKMATGNYVEFFAEVRYTRYGKRKVLKMSGRAIKFCDVEKGIGLLASQLTSDLRKILRGNLYHIEVIMPLQIISPGRCSGALEARVQL
ncbi:hypothetical protein FB451DRAFT_1374123 [Mycena latifolia]|nr:hypothetical protein FB451DRAFT_1374123 [Mycena latifolia]